MPMNSFFGAGKQELKAVHHELRCHIAQSLGFSIQADTSVNFGQFWVNFGQF
jgi:hypothetical protein